MNESSEVVIYEVHDCIGTITINRPSQLNSLNLNVLEKLLFIINELEDEIRRGVGYKKIRTLVIRGAGDKSFVAGADIKFMSESDPDTISNFIKLGQSVMSSISNLSLPVIAAVRGFCLGGGLELALACDLILATKNSTLGLPEVTLGLIPGFGGTQRLIPRVGLGRAKRIIYSGKSTNAEEALHCGLIDYLCEDIVFDQKLEEINKVIISRPPLAIAAAKRSINSHVSQSLDYGLEKEVAEFISVFRTQDAKTGISAFINKTKPIFTGR